MEIIIGLVVFYLLWKFFDNMEHSSSSNSSSNSSTNNAAEETITNFVISFADPQNSQIERRIYTEHDFKYSYINNSGNTVSGTVSWNSKIIMKRKQILNIVYYSFVYKDVSDFISVFSKDNVILEYTKTLKNIDDTEEQYQAIEHFEYKDVCYCYTRNIANPDSALVLVPDVNINGEIDLFVLEESDHHEAFSYYEAYKLSQSDHNECILIFHNNEPYIEMCTHIYNGSGYVIFASTNIENESFIVKKFANGEFLDINDSTILNVIINTANSIYNALPSDLKKLFAIKCDFNNVQNINNDDDIIIVDGTMHSNNLLNGVFVRIHDNAYDNTYKVFRFIDYCDYCNDTYVVLKINDNVSIARTIIDEYSNKLIGIESVEDNIATEVERLLKEEHLRESNYCFGVNDAQLSSNTTNDFDDQYTENISIIENIISSKVVGVTFEGRPETIRKCINDNLLKSGTYLTLIAEPDNIYDKYAVGVYIGPYKIGYISRGLLTALRAKGLNHDNISYCKVTHIEPGDTSYGINIEIKLNNDSFNNNPSTCSNRENNYSVLNSHENNHSDNSIVVNRSKSDTDPLLVTIDWETSLNNGIINSSGISVRPVPYFLVENRKEWYNSSAVCPYDRDMELYKLRARGTYTIFEGKKTHLFNLFTCPICRRFYASVTTSNDPLNTSLPLTQYALVSKQYKKEEYDHMITTAMNTWNCNE